MASSNTVAGELIKLRQYITSIADASGDVKTPPTLQTVDMRKESDKLVEDVNKLFRPTDDKTPQIYLGTVVILHNRRRELIDYENVQSYGKSKLFKTTVRGSYNGG